MGETSVGSWQSLLIFMVSAGIWLFLLMATSPEKDSKCSMSIDDATHRRKAILSTGGSSNLHENNNQNNNILDAGMLRAQRLISRVCPRYRKNVAVVMPFIKKQVDDLIANLEEWREYFPCLPSASLPNEPNNVRLIFYFNNDRDEEVEKEILAAWEDVREHPRVIQDDDAIVEPQNQRRLAKVGDCFSQVSFLWANMGEDTLNHDKNTGVMFRLLFSFLRDLNVDYFFQMVRQFTFVRW